MWKFVGLGALFQIVLLVALLDVYVYKEPSPLCSSNPYDCPSYLLIFDVNGLKTNNSDKSFENRRSNDSGNYSIFDDQNELLRQNPVNLSTMIACDEPCEFGHASELWIAGNVSNLLVRFVKSPTRFDGNETAIWSTFDDANYLNGNQSSAVFVVTSSKVHNEEVHIIWNEDFFKSTFQKNENLIRNESFNITANFAQKTNFQSDNDRFQTLPMLRYFVEGNLLDFFRYDTSEFVWYSFSNRNYYHLNSLEAIATVFSIFNSLRIEMDIVVVAIAYIMFISWILLLIATILKDSKDEAQRTFDGLNVIFLATVFSVFVIFSYFNYPTRYYFYYLAGISMVRMLFENCASFKTILFHVFNNRTNTMFAIALIYVTVESLFWCLWCDSIIVTFVLLGGANVIHGFIYNGKLKTELALALSSCFTGIASLLPSMHLNKLFLLNVGSLFWISGTFLSLFCFMSKIRIDWFLSVLAISEYLGAAIIQNWFHLIRISQRKILCTTSLFVVLSALLPFFGEPQTKFRIPQIGIAAASFYLFVSSERQVLVLFGIFATALCLCFREIVPGKEENSKSESLHYFSSLLHVAVFLMATQLVVPVSVDYLFELSRQFFVLGLSSDLLSVFLVYFVKLAFAVNMLEATLLASYSADKKFPALMFVILMFNLVSLRSFVHLSLFPQTVNKRRLLIIHMLTQPLAAMLLYFYPFVRLQCEASFFQLCQRKEPSLPSRINASSIRRHRT